MIKDEEILQVANDESQQDWDKLDYRNVYKYGFIDGAKWAVKKVVGVQLPVKPNFADTILQEFLDWNKKYPPNKIFNFNEINKISGELSIIMDKAQKHLDNSKISV